MRVYLDNAATTCVDAEVLQKMIPYFNTIFGNANSMHSYGRESNKAVMEARSRVAEAINAKPNEIYFTSGGTESDNWALRGVAKKLRSRGKHIIVSKIEHAAILTTAKHLEKEGYDLTYVDVDEQGIIDLRALEAAIRDDTILISVMSANNEIGTLQPIQEISAIAKTHNILFHTDAVQAFGSIDLDVRRLGAQLVSLSSHKIYGPKGIGALYIESGVLPEKLITGGHQERTMRGGTTNVPLAVGFGYAAENAKMHLEENAKRIRELRDYFITQVQSRIENVILNGHRERRLNGNCNFSFLGIEGESILQSLDLLANIAVSTGSACSSGSLEPSHVLLATGMPIEHAHGSIRFSFGKHNTKEEADYVLNNLERIIKRLRDMSPLKY